MNVYEYFLPPELWQEILEYLKFLKSKIRLTLVCKYFHKNLRIYDLCNVNIKLSDNVLKKLSVYQKIGYK